MLFCFMQCLCVITLNEFITSLHLVSILSANSSSQRLLTFILDVTSTLRFNTTLEFRRVFLFGWSFCGELRTYSSDVKLERALRRINVMDLNTIPSVIYIYFFLEIQTSKFHECTLRSPDESIYIITNNLCLVCVACTRTTLRFGTCLIIIRFH